MRSSTCSGSWWTEPTRSGPWVTGRLSPFMKRTFSLLLFVALVALAGCGSTGAVAASINGHDISSDDVTRGAHGFGTSALFRQQLSQQGVDLRPTGSVPTAFAAQWLVSLIQTEAIHQYAAKHHVTASDQEVAQAKQQFSGTSQSAQAFKQLPKWLQHQIVQTTALQLALRSTLKPAVSDAKLTTAYQQLAADCPSKKLIGHILVSTPEAAQQAIDRINGGETFAAVASAVSTDTGSSSQGGLLMCQDGSQWSQLDATFRAGAEAVPVGKISAPVQTQFGYHVIEAVDLTPENARPLVLAAVQAADPLAPVLGKFIKRSKITVNPRFGKLQRSGTSFTINPPTPKKVRSLPSNTPSTTRPASTPTTGAQSSSATSSTTATSSPGLRRGSSSSGSARPAST
jgi:parvulin-like peptidyl-prolyl isomerase